MTALTKKRAALLRVVLSVLVVIGTAAFVAVGCPDYRDGIPGQLAQAHDEAESAAHSGTSVTRRCCEARRRINRKGSEVWSPS
jgi:hypothetical protein